MLRALRATPLPHFCRTRRREDNGTRRTARPDWALLTTCGCCDHLFSLRVVFLSILGSHLGPRSATLERLSADFRDFLANFGPPCVFPPIEGARGQCWDRFWVSRGASREGFLEDFGSFLASLRSFVAPKFCSNFVPSLSKFQISRCSAVGSGLGWPALQLQGRWSRGAC